MDEDAVKNERRFCRPTKGLFNFRYYIKMVISEIFK